MSNQVKVEIFKSNFSQLGYLNPPMDIIPLFQKEMFKKHRRYFRSIDSMFPCMRFVVSDAVKSSVINPLCELAQGLTQGKYIIADCFPPITGMWDNSTIEIISPPTTWREECRIGLCLNWVVALSDPATLLFREHRLVINEVELGVGSLFVMDWGLPHRFHTNKMEAEVAIIQIALLESVAG